MRKRTKRGGAIELMRSAFKSDQESTSQDCPSCGVTFRANPTQLRVWNGKCHECHCKEDRKMSYGDADTNLELVRLWIANATLADLRTLRAIINGKLSRRTISPEQQEKMQEARNGRKVT